MVFATLVSSGRSSTWTPDGLTRIWSKMPTTPMRNQDVTPDSPAWYYLEDVQWTQYFNGAYALHAAYWHNSFGFTRSHGCVNLSILDAKWLFDWTTPYTPTRCQGCLQQRWRRRYVGLGSYDVALAQYRGHALSETPTDIVWA